MSESAGAVGDVQPGRASAGTRWIPGGTFRMDADTGDTSQPRDIRR